jgi:hypothetical protein
VTRAEQVELDSVAKAFVLPVAPACYPLLGPALAVLAAEAWRADRLCLMCPRPGHKHVCSCPHHLTRKWAMARGIWPEVDIA